jgi:hypothetical protein
LPAARFCFADASLVGLGWPAAFFACTAGLRCLTSSAVPAFGTAIGRWSRSQGPAAVDRNRVFLLALDAELGKVGFSLCAAPNKATAITILVEI